MSEVSAGVLAAPKMSSPISDQYTGQPDTFMELKTSMVIRRGNASDEARFEKRAKFHRHAHFSDVH